MLCAISAVLREDTLSGSPSSARRLICVRMYGAGSGGGLPVLGDAKCAAEMRSVSQGIRAMSVANERTSEAKCPQGGANEPRLTVR